MRGRGMFRGVGPKKVEISEESHPQNTQTGALPQQLIDSRLAGYEMDVGNATAAGRNRGMWPGRTRSWSTRLARCAATSPVM